MLVAVGRWLVIVLVQSVTDAIYGGVSKAWLRGVVVAELAVQWRTLDVCLGVG